MCAIVWGWQQSDDVHRTADRISKGSPWWLRHGDVTYPATSMVRMITNQVPARHDARACASSPRGGLGWAELRLGTCGMQLRDEQRQCLCRTHHQITANMCFHFQWPVRITVYSTRPSSHLLVRYSCGWTVKDDSVSVRETNKRYKRIRLRSGLKWFYKIKTRKK